MADTEDVLQVWTHAAPGVYSHPTLGLVEKRRLMGARVERWHWIRIADAPEPGKAGTDGRRYVPSYMWVTNFDTAREAMEFANEEAHDVA